MELAEILEKFPDHINYGKRADVFHRGRFVGHIYQDNNECIYEVNGKVNNIQFLSHFKHRKILSVNLWGCSIYLYLLQEILDE